jgi:hypothetical protein
MLVLCQSLHAAGSDLADANDRMSLSMLGSHIELGRLLLETIGRGKRKWRAAISP